MFKPEKRTLLHFIIFAAFASLFAWFFYIKFKPVVVFRTCSKFAERSSRNSNVEGYGIVCDCSYDQLLQDCLDGADEIVN